jgi:formylglycine-generating enzyme required for sulfatase activity
MRIRKDLAALLVALLWVPGSGAADPGGGQPSRVTNNSGMEFVLVNPGQLTLPDRQTGGARTLTVGEPFYLGKLEVTQEQWRKVMGSNPSVHTGSDHPVEMVSWLDCVAFCDRLSALEGRRYRLPTAVEWEYACRGGSKGDFCFGDDEKSLGEYAWYAANSGDGVDGNGHAVNGSTHPVGQRKPNTWGFFDMHGNVREWCQDEGTPSEQAVTHRKELLAKNGTPMPDSWRLMGGGCYQFQAFDSWCCRWQPYPNTDRSFVLGFRAALDLDVPKAGRP